MKEVVNVHEFKTHYSRYLDQVIDGNEILLGKHGKAVARVVPLNNANKPRVPGALKGKIWISDDFDEPMMALWDTIGIKQ